MRRSFSGARAGVSQGAGASPALSDEPPNPDNAQPDKPQPEDAEPGAALDCELSGLASAGGGWTGPAGIRSWIDSSHSICDPKRSPKQRDAMVMISSSEGCWPVSNSIEVTGRASPQGTMNRKKSRLVVTLSAKPC